MIVGAAAVELRVHGSQSLKAKRGVVRSIVRRVRNRFNVSVSEVGGQDTWQRAVLGLTTVGGEAPVVRAVLDKALAYIEELHLAEVMHSDVEIVAFPYQEGDDPEGDDLDAEADADAAED